MKKSYLLLVASLLLSFTAQAAVHVCTPAANSLAWCLTQADTLVLTDGVYEEAYTIKFETPGIVLRAAEGAKPVRVLKQEKPKKQTTRTTIRKEVFKLEPPKKDVKKAV